MRVSVLSLSLLALGMSLPAGAAAPPGRYTFPAEGTVYDTRTKLTWQRAVVSDSFQQPAAILYCTGLSLQGTGWRLPLRAELATLVDPTQSRPAIDPTAFPDTPLRAFWAFNQYPSSGGLFWFVDFTNGSADAHPSTALYGARCVR